MAIRVETIMGKVIVSQRFRRARVVKAMQQGWDYVYMYLVWYVVCNGKI